MFICPLCTKTFKYPSVLDRHMVAHTKEKPHKCPICPEAFGRKNGVKQHIKIVHDGIQQTRNENHQCTMCSFKSRSTSNLQAHMRTHSAERPFSCRITGCGFKTKYKCNLLQHAHQVHSDKRPFKCPSDGCNYKATTRANIRQHLKIHSNDKPFVCTVPGCNYTCKSKGNLKSHTFTVHSNEKPFKCSVCVFRTKYNEVLRLHELTHTGIKHFQCQAPNCGFTSNQPCNLKRHFDSKHRASKVLCTEPRCNFRCGSVTLLKVHLKKHQLPILKCPRDLCGFRTKYNYHLLKHISSRHHDHQSAVTGLGTTESDLKTAGTMNTLKCNFTDCSFQTKFRQHYTRHVLTHKKKEKGQHVCSFCYSRFSNSSLLTAHVQRHIREKPYSCSHCTFTTMDSQWLKRHAKKIHSIHVLPCGKDDQVGKCRTCVRNCFSYGESVLHSMSHLQPVVVLEQLKLHVL